MELFGRYIRRILIVGFGAICLMSVGCTVNRKSNVALPKSVPQSHQNLVKNLFEQAWDDIYEQGWCHRNIRDFLNFLESGQISTKDARVLIIFKKNDEGYIPLNTRNPVLKPWFFHVVMEFEGEIYDFDFMNRPTVMETRTYLKKILGVAEPRKTYVMKRMTPDEFRALPNRYFNEYSRFEQSTLSLDWFDIGAAPAAEAATTPASKK